MMYTMSGKSISGFGPTHGGFGFEDETEALCLFDDLPRDDLLHLLPSLPTPPPPQQHQGASEEAAQPQSSFVFDGQDHDHDLFDLMTGRPEDITGQSPAWKMEDDKREVLQHLDNHQNSTGMELENNVDLTQDLIQEMKDFLAQYEAGEGSDAAEDYDEVDNLAKDLLSLEQQCTLRSTDAPCPAESALLTEEDTRVAEEMLDALLEQVDPPGHSEKLLEAQPADLLQLAMETEILSDSGFVEEEEPEERVTVSSVSKHPTTDGNVIIVVTPSAYPSSDSSPSQRGDGDDSDSDWTPDSEVFSSREKTTSRKPEAGLLGVSKSSGRVGRGSPRTVVDRKERKKVQNMEAARRYRDKKKREQSEAEDEVTALVKKNAGLKSRLHDVENEMRTMKKLMVELGFLKVIPN